MATTLLSLVVVVAVTYNIAIMYFPIDKKKRVTLSLIVSGILVVCCLAENGQRDCVPLTVKEHIAKNPYPKGPLMARFNITEEQLNHEPQRTPIEAGVCMVLVLAFIVTPILLNIANNNDKKEKMKVLEGVAFALNIVTVWALLSLFYGFELPTFVPWFKKTQEEEEPVPVLT